jgi:isoquinoline 1-oxidoreductase
MVFVFDVGIVIDPNGLRNQAQGALIQGIGGALFEELEFDSNHITNGRLSKYRVPRFSDVPEIHIILMSRPTIPATGAGEAPITVVAPAIAAALRGRIPGDLRSLPLARNLPA